MDVNSSTKLNTEDMSNYKAIPQTFTDSVQGTSKTTLQNAPIPIAAHHITSLTQCVPSCSIGGERNF